MTAKSTTSANITWNLVPGAAGYNIYLENGSQLQWLGAVSANSNSVNVTHLTASSTVTFVVEAYNATQVADSSAVSIALPTPPPVDTALQLSITPPPSAIMIHRALGPVGLCIG